MRLKEFRENCIAACSTHRRRKSVPDPWRRNREVPTSTGGGSKRRYHQVISRGRPESPPTSLSANWKAQFSNVVRSSTSRSLPNQRSNFDTMLNMVSCGCKADGCSNMSCSCKKFGHFCTSTQCSGQTCNSSPPILLDVKDDQINTSKVNKIFIFIIICHRSGYFGFWTLLFLV